MAALRSRLRGAIVWSANPLEINVETKLISGGCRNDDADGVKAGLPVQRGVNFAESSSGLWPTKTSPAPHPLRARASPRSWREVLYCWCWRLVRTVVGRISGHNPNFRLSNADCYRVGIPQTRQTHASPRLTIWSTGPSASVAVTGQLRPLQAETPIEQPPRNGARATSLRSDVTAKRPRTSSRALTSSRLRIHERALLVECRTLTE
jgi:hypothetical protein